MLAQQFNAGAMRSGMSPSTVPIGAGPGGMGGGANADFDSLIDLIVSTVSTETWAENGGGEAEIRPFPTNLSLVISQTQAVHEEIADLLEQLRRLQDLQVTIEVRFIRLNDSFFERIGIDFDMNIDDRHRSARPTSCRVQPFESGRPQQHGRSATPVPPTNPFPNFTTDLDIPFRQDSFDLAHCRRSAVRSELRPTFGFAILSDIEAYFLIEAAQGDTPHERAQRAEGDAVQRPAGLRGRRHAAAVRGRRDPGRRRVRRRTAAGDRRAQRRHDDDDPGRRLRRSALRAADDRAVLHADRRRRRVHVRRLVVDARAPAARPTTTTTARTNPKRRARRKSRSGVTVQLPSFSFVSVVTTVSVPDGGTVLLGGIKRLTEGRNEFGVPLLSKVPYINRLFRNVGIGRETDSLMMMVTPRIIIQEEEEERLGIDAP